MNERDVAGFFIWDLEKERLNIVKHGVSFREAAIVFMDPGLRIFFDEKHSKTEERLFAIGKAGEKILTVRFTFRDGKIRIFGAGSWRNGRMDYEKNKEK